MILLESFLFKDGFYWHLMLYHDSSAALVSEEGDILAAAQEERFSRLKNDSRFPFYAIEYCLKEAKFRNLNKCLCLLRKTN